MKLARVLVQKAVLLALTMVSLGTASLAQTGNSAATLRLTVAPAVASPIQIKTLPNAACTLHPEGSEDAAHRLKLYADGEGMVHFHARPDVVSDIQVRTNTLVGTGNAVLVVECSASGQIATHRVELRAASVPTSEMPAPTVPVKAAGTIRRALTNEELSSLSDEELVMAHYPPRPDPKGAPKAYAAWLTAVSRPTTLVAPQTVLRPDIVHGPPAPNPICSKLLTPCTISNQQSPNWSGYAMLNYTTNTGQWFPFKAVLGMWQVPQATGENTLGSRTMSAFWIGLDGVTGLSNVSNQEVVQDGTDQSAVDQLMWSDEMQQWIHWDLATYFAWTEWFPEPMQAITNFTVNPGDLILSEVWVGRSPDNCTLYHSLHITVCFFLGL